MLANRAGYRPALHPDPEASPRVGIVHWAGLIAPSRVVINAVGRVGDHKARRDATEHARNVGRHCAVAAERAMAAEAGRPKAEPAPGSLEYQALHPEWKPQED